LKVAGGFGVIERLLVLWYFISTRWLPAPRNRTKRLQRFLAEAPRFADVMTKRLFLEHFTALNRHGITLEQATEVALRAERERDFKPELPGGITVGLSSGTSGSRQVFLVGRADRCRWAGQMLARMLSTSSLWRIFNVFTPPLRIAFFLRASSNLYTTLSSSRVKFEYFDLTRPLDELIDRLNDYRPELLVAPATVLAELARFARVKPRQVLSVAEVLDAKDCAAIEKAFAVPVAQIYQAAEGFLGCTCSQGRMHLNEESLHIEPEWLDEKRERFHPIITDFSRKTQWFVRHRLDDILQLEPTPCPCGRDTMTLKRIEGRAEEVLWLRHSSGDLSPVFPDVLRQALYTQPVERYRIEQHGHRWRIQLLHGNEVAVQVALEKLIDGLQLERPTFDFQQWTEQPPSEKQKRIRCITKPS
jgi:putative adenylate-forming enzyme